MADKNIKVVNFDQLELLLKYAVALTDANASGKFLQSDQYFLSTEGGKLTIYNGAGTVKYDSSSAFSVLEYVKKVEWWGSDKEHDQYSHTFIGQDDEGQSTEYHIEKIEKIDSSESTTYLPYIRIGANVYKIPVTTLNGSANNAPSFYAPTDAGTSGQYLTSSGAGAPVWASFPAFIASISYDGTNYQYRFLQSNGDYFDIPQADWNAAEGSGSFIRNKPSIPAAQVNSDWNAASGVAEILNKPTIPTITLNGSTTTTPSFYAPTSAGSTAGQYLKWDGSAAVWDTFPTIPTITLNGSATTSPSFYAVTSAGSTAGQYLKWDGSAIVWDNFPTIPDAVSGVNDGTNWTSITIGAVTKAIPAGGSGTPSDYIKSMSAANNTLSWTEVVAGVETQQSYTFSGGGGGTSNYADLSGKPQIGGVELASGNNTLAALGLQALIDASHKLDYSLLDNTPAIPDAVSGVNDGTNWTSITIGNVTKAIPSGGGGGEPAAYIKDAALSNNNHTLTLTKKDGTTTVVFNDTTYSDATQSASGLMSAADKTKLDATGELIWGGSISGSNHTDSHLSTTNVAQYRLMTIFVQPGYPTADTGKLISASFDPNVVISGTTIAQRQNLESWNDEAHLYIYSSDGYIHCNLGGAGDCTISRIVAYK